MLLETADTQEPQKEPSSAGNLVLTVKHPQISSLWNCKKINMLFEDPRLAVFCYSCGRKGAHSLLPVGPPKSLSPGPLMEGDLWGPADRTLYPVTSYLPGKVPPTCAPFTEPVDWALSLNSENVVPLKSSTCSLETQHVSIHRDLGSAL